MSEPVLKPGENCGEILDVEESGILIDAGDYYLSFSEAAARAKNYILLAGWQFDSRVRLRRGSADDEDWALVSFLNRLCEENRDLRIYILAWDFSFLFAMDREWMQQWLFPWKAHERVTFRFDDRHPIGASHHQKFAVIDGHFGFAGGIDICEERWDENPHRSENPLRKTSKGKPYSPFHDTQAAVTGPGVRALTAVFEERWRRACGERLELPPPRKIADSAVRTTIGIPAGQAALSRTENDEEGSEERAVREIRSLYRDAILSAERMLYLENQHFTSRSICDALVERMKRGTENRIEIVIVLPEKPRGFLEEVAILEAQRHAALKLRRAAGETGHELGIYYSTSIGEDGRGEPTHIHSKVLLVDDRFITIGSANATNRSMGLDTELNISFEASPGDRELVLSLRHIRSALLHDHSGIDTGTLMESDALVPLLERHVETPDTRLHHHPMMTTDLDEEQKRISFLDPGILDIEEPITLERVSENFFVGGMPVLRQLFTRED